MIFFKPLPGLLSLSSFVLANDSVSAADHAAIKSLRSSNYGTTTGSSYAYAVLNYLLQGKVLFPGSTAYQAEDTQFYDLREDLSPKCIFVPANTNDVVKGVVALEVCKSEFAIRGASHMPV